MNLSNLINVVYLAASVLFIVGLKGLTSPRTARRGNGMASLAMLIAICATLLDHHIVSYQWILIGIALGSIIGAVAAIKVPLTAMPELVAMFNGFGGGASALVAATAVLAPETLTGVPPVQLYVASAVSAIVGAATLTGSLVAWAKLLEVLRWQPLGKLVRFANMAALLSCIGLGACLVIDPRASWVLWSLLGAASFYGILLTVPVGGADMPVVIALLNSCSGLAAAATGFVLGNNVLIISGSLVGASGFILTRIMCRAMNRSLIDVLAGNLGGGGGGGGVSVSQGDDLYQGRVKSSSPDEAAMILETSRVVTIVPGYDMAVAQAQHDVREFASILQDRGVEVRYGIHPVAGRMPGHMNVLLAEADVPYDELYDLEQINPTFSETDVVLVLGANDVVNPAARDEPQSPIYGMPILEVGKARTVMIVKRSLSPGFAGIPNKLFVAPNALMLFGDGKQVMRELVIAVDELGHL
jgi:NAD(P) transhydrogenase subunit beta